VSNPSFDTEQMLGWIEAQTGLGPRRPGSPAGRRNETNLAETLAGFGCQDVRLEPIPVTHWDAREWSLEPGEGEPIPSFPIPYCAFTPEAGVEGRLVFANSRGGGRDWRGAIVVAEIAFPQLEVGLLLRLAYGAHDPDNTLRDVNHPATWVRLGWHLYRLAVERGAAGFVGILKDQPGGSCEMYAPYGFKETDILDKPLPGVWVGRGAGPALRRLAALGTRARLRVRGLREASLTHNVVAEIPGDSSEVLVVGCHHDSPFTSPVEDASGVAVVLALAQHFAKHPLRRRLVVLLTAGHFYGSIGTRTFIREHPDVVANTAAEVHIEHIAREAVEDAQGRLVATGLPEASGVFVPLNRTVADLVLDSFRAHDVDRTLVLPAEGPLGRYPPTDGGDWYEAGVPVVNCISNPVYLLTNQDALEWVDTKRLATMTAAFAQILRGLDSLPRQAIAHVDSRRHLLLLKFLEALSRHKTTRFGTRPIY
jgi:peptidase M28-like protein